MAEQELRWLAAHKDQIAALGEDPHLVEALEQQLARTAARAQHAPPPAPYDAGGLRLDDAFAARARPGDERAPPPAAASVWLDQSAPPRAPPPPPPSAPCRTRPPPTSPRGWTRAVDPASGYAYRYDARGNSVWEHELRPQSQPMPSARPARAAKRAARDQPRSASSDDDSSSYDSPSDSSDDDCCECFRPRPAYKKLSTT